MMKEGKRSKRFALPSNFGILDDEELVLRATMRWIVSGVMPTREETLKTERLWEQDLVMTRAAYEFVADAPAVAADIEGANTL